MFNCLNPFSDCSFSFFTDNPRTRYNVHKNEAFLNRDNNMKYGLLDWAYAAIQKTTTVHKKDKRKLLARLQILRGKIPTELKYRCSDSISTKLNSIMEQFSSNTYSRLYYTCKVIKEVAERGDEFIDIKTRIVSKIKGVGTSNKANRSNLLTRIQTAETSSEIREALRSSKTDLEGSPMFKTRALFSKKSKLLEEIENCIIDVAYSTNKEIHKSDLTQTCSGT